MPRKYVRKNPAPGQADPMRGNGGRPAEFSYDFLTLQPSSGTNGTPQFLRPTPTAPAFPWPGPNGVAVMGPNGPMMVPNGHPLPAMQHGRNHPMPMIPMTPFTAFGGQMWHGPPFGFPPTRGLLQAPPTPSWIPTPATTPLLQAPPTSNRMPAPPTPNWIPAPSPQHSATGAGPSVQNRANGFGTIGAPGPIGNDGPQTPRVAQVHHSTNTPTRIHQHPSQAADERQGASIPNPMHFFGTTGASGPTGYDAPPVLQLGPIAESSDSSNQIRSAPLSTGSSTNPAAGSLGAPISHSSSGIAPSAAKSAPSASGAPLLHSRSSIGASTAASLEAQLQDLSVSAHAPAPSIPAPLPIETVRAPAPNPATPPRDDLRLAASRSSRFFPYTPPTEQQQRRKMLLGMESQIEMKKLQDVDDFWTAACLNDEKMLEEEEKQREEEAASRRQAKMEEAKKEAAEIKEQRKKSKEEGSLMTVERMKEGWRLDQVMKTLWKLDGEARLKFIAEELEALKKALKKDKEEKEKKDKKDDDGPSTSGS
ncbi:hypothetical protein B9Z55_007371 [Caenorhabditis nigoni]|uniref:Uncharacterized protein n=1 Tax=Caenorhabditis nigoni TaxID=1611254 RepID=A0A2G5V9G8_9PELO|nr:hypothetical protein B9Z55_007371 [Caenorhabditis nigoni]